jgi:hypothetical protein
VEDGNDMNVLLLQRVNDVVMVLCKQVNSVIYEMEMVLHEVDVIHFVK